MAVSLLQFLYPTKTYQEPFAFFYFSTACDDDDSACIVSGLFKVVWLLKRAQTMLESNWHAQYGDKQEKKIPFLSRGHVVQTVV